MTMWRRASGRWMLAALAVGLLLGGVAWGQLIPWKTDPVTQPATKPASTQASTTGPATTQEDEEPPPGVGPKALQPWERRGPKPEVFRDPPVNVRSLRDEDVVDAIRRGCDFLLDDLKTTYAPLKKDAPEAEKQAWLRNAMRMRWSNYMGGTRMLSIYALLVAGKALDEPKLRFNSADFGPHVDWALAFDAKNAAHMETYVAALQACALAQLPARPEFRKALTRVKDELLDLMLPTGGYTYGRERMRFMGSMGGWDNSNTQYGLLGVWAAADVGADVKASYWRTSDQFWRRVQCKEGGWDYSNGMSLPRPSMTAAGVASLYVTQDYLDAELRLEPRQDKSLTQGLEELIHEYNVGWDDMYYMYSLERVGLASGLKFFNGVNWYREGATNLVNWQKPDGTWGGSFMGASPVVSTAYAVLFLVRGRSPVVFNKLQYDGPWNARERDVANLTNWMGKRFERAMNWQVVDSKTDAEEWLDAPILLITGSRDPKFTKEQLANLRKYVEAGGTIFSSCDGERSAFTTAMRKAAGDVMGGKYEMQELPLDHLLYHCYAPLTNPPRMWGASNGVRTYWIHSPLDLGATWFLRRPLPADRWEIAANLLFYAVGGQGSLRSKLDPLTVADPKEPPARSVRVTRLEHVGNCDPEPGAWVRLAKLLRRDARIDVVVTSGAVKDLSEQKPTLVHMTGTVPFKLDEAERAKLKAYLDGGGTLFADAAGGAVPFMRSFAELVVALYPGESLMPVVAGDLLLNGRLPDSVEVRTVDYRKFWLVENGNSHTVRLLGLQRNGRWVIVFSPDDVSTGFLGTHTWGISGYDPVTAQRLGRNILLYAAAGGVVPAPATAPASAPATMPIFVPVEPPASMPATEPGLVGP